MDKSKLFRNIALGGIVAGALLAASPSFAKCGPADWYGSAVAAGYAPDRTVTVSAKTRNLNVKYNETVKFVVEDGARHEVTWKFDGFRDKVMMSDIDPQTSLKTVPIYVDQSSNPITSSECGD